jgi:uncharacterized protein (DUF2249 family)
MIEKPGSDSVTLDVRPVLAAGDEPLMMIMDAAARIPPGGALEIIAPFEPVPLYAVLGGRGFRHRTEVRGPDEYAVRFTRRVTIAPGDLVGEICRRLPATADVFAKYGLDLCCGGVKPLAVVAAAHGVPLEELITELEDAATFASGDTPE